MRHQEGYIWKKSGAWFGRWREDVLVGNKIVHQARVKRLAPVCDRYRSKSDVQPLLDDILRPINEGRSNPHSVMTVAKFYENHFKPHIKAERKPATAVAYDSIWKPYLCGHLESAIMRDFRCVDATNLLAAIHVEHGVGRKTLRNCKALLSSIFTYAKQTGVLDGFNPVKDSAIPRKAAKPKPTHATTADEILAMLDALTLAIAEAENADTAKHLRIGRRAVALIYFGGLRPEEARGARWEEYNGKRLPIMRAVWRTHVHETKTEGSQANIPICERLREILDEDREPAGYILAGIRSAKPINLADLARRYIRPALLKRKVAWYGWYAMRRGIGTLATAVESPLAAKGLLRHTNVATTQQFYIKDVPEETERAMKKIDALFDAKEGAVQ
jgi:integrase